MAWQDTSKLNPAHSSGRVRGVNPAASSSGATLTTATTNLVLVLFSPKAWNVEDYAPHTTYAWRTIRKHEELVCRERVSCERTYEVLESYSEAKIFQLKEAVSHASPISLRSDKIGMFRQNTGFSWQYRNTLQLNGREISKYVYRNEACQEPSTLPLEKWIVPIYVSEKKRWPSWHFLNWHGQAHYERATSA